MSKRKSASGHNDDLLDEKSYENTTYEVVPYWKLAEKSTELWYRTVQEYLGLDLTFQSDRMAASAAPTQRMERLRVDDQFLAGLWKKTLLLDLLWMVWPRPKDAHGRPHMSKGPTWSWISVHGQVI